MKIEINDKIIEVIKKRVEESNEFDSVENYIDYILKQLVERLKNEKGAGNNEQSFSKEDEEKVKERLRGLGYLD